ncbi:MAG: cation-translocating P-type ATPase [Ruminococcus sp.]|uniref:cation-translocating P-type ATPase n=1 Tax=Ruminococcus sp. TaxID=41978 RepID=UPI0025F536A0|nr:cation-translocating P-type ATPase [Ruminococcus sp.]MBR6994963.1 cation-translocating P-type ATPase [Ruminococcus sp.]
MGLTEKEAAERLKAQGENTLGESRRTGPMRIFLGQFRDVMVMILLGATVISVLLGEISDAVTIILIVLLNAILGFVQEYRTENTLEALRSMTSPTAKCWRDGKLKEIDASQLVTGDVIELEAGDRIPADCAVLKAAGFFSDEALLTGESVAVGKSAGDESDTDNSLNKSNIVYCGASATKGTCRARVIATGMATQMGRISEMLRDIDKEPTPLQKRLGELGKVVAIICLVVCIAVFGAGVLRGENVFDMLMTGITIAIAAIPEGLPATVTIALALAVSRMLKQKALVNKLHSVETLGCTSVICSDKTGTITENRMTVTELSTAEDTYLFSGMGYRVSGAVTKGEIAVNPVTEKALSAALRCGVLCSTAEISAQEPPKSRNRGTLAGKGEWSVTGDPTEAALLIAAAKAGITRQSLSAGYRSIGEFPFDSETRFMAVHVVCGSEKRIYFKGAEEVLLPRCSMYLDSSGKAVPMTAAMRRSLAERAEDMSQRALRVLALAVCTSEGLDPQRRDLVFLGFAGMTDPPREEAKTAIRKCSAASVKTVMITGDHKNTAVAVAKKAGLLKGGKAMTGAELDCLSDEELDRCIGEYTVFARVEPVHKLRIVRSFRRRGEIVTMTGDGVNDAPAVKEADVGVAMGVTGTDVTKQAADVILMDDNLATLVNAVEQGRCVYANIRKFVRYLLSCNIGEVLTMFLGLLMGMPVVLLPVQILLVNLVTDGLPAVALGMEPPEKDIMSRPPRRSDEGFFSGGLMRRIVFRGILIGLSTLGSFGTVMRMGGSIEACRTAALITLVVSQLIHVFECRSEKRSLFRLNPFGNMKLVGAAALSAAVLAAAVMVPQLQVVFSTVTPDMMQLLTALGFSVAVPVICGVI